MVTGLETASTSLDPIDYANNQLVLTICDLVSNLYGSWSGSSKDILEAANAESRLTGITQQQLVCDIESIADLLLEYDRIQYLSLKDSPKEAIRHVFWTCE